MAEKIGLEEAVKLVWKDILQEEEENYTDEFRYKVIMTTRKIMGLEAI